MLLFIGFTKKFICFFFFPLNLRENPNKLFAGITKYFMQDDKSDLFKLYILDNYLYILDKQ